MNLPIDYSRATWQERKSARLEYINIQNNLCYFCKEPLNSSPAKFVLDANIRWGLFPKNFQNNPIHLHHSHRTGMTIGATHMRCNAYLWQYKGE